MLKLREQLVWLLFLTHGATHYARASSENLAKNNEVAQEEARDLLKSVEAAVDAVKLVEVVGMETQKEKRDSTQQTGYAGVVARRQSANEQPFRPIHRPQEQQQQQQQHQSLEDESRSPQSQYYAFRPTALPFSASTPVAPPSVRAKEDQAVYEKPSLGAAPSTAHTTGGILYAPSGAGPHYIRLIPAARGTYRGAHDAGAHQVASAPPAQPPPFQMQPQQPLVYSFAENYAPQPHPHSQPPAHHHAYPQSQQQHSPIQYVIAIPVNYARPFHAELSRVPEYAAAAYAVPQSLTPPHYMLGTRQAQQAIMPMPRPVHYLLPAEAQQQPQHHVLQSQRPQSYITQYIQVPLSTVLGSVQKASQYAQLSHHQEEQHTAKQIEPQNHNQKQQLQREYAPQQQQQEDQQPQQQQQQQQQEQPVLVRIGGGHSRSSAAHSPFIAQYHGALLAPAAPQLRTPPLMHYNPVYVQAPPVEQEKQLQHQQKPLHYAAMHFAVGGDSAVPIIRLPAPQALLPPHRLHLAHPQHLRYHYDSQPLSVEQHQQHLQSIAANNGQTVSLPATVPYFSQPSAVQYGTHLIGAPTAQPPYQHRQQHYQPHQLQQLQAPSAPSAPPNQSHAVRLQVVNFASPTPSGSKQQQQQPHASTSTAAATSVAGVAGPDAANVVKYP